MSRLFIFIIFVLIDPLHRVVLPKAGYHRYKEEFYTNKDYAYNIGVIIQKNISNEDYQRLLKHGPSIFDETPPRLFKHGKKHINVPHTINHRPPTSGYYKCRTCGEIIYTVKKYKGISFSDMSLKFKSVKENKWRVRKK